MQCEIHEKFKHFLKIVESIIIILTLKLVLFGKNQIMKHDALNDKTLKIEISHTRVKKSLVTYMCT